MRQRDGEGPGTGSGKRGNVPRWERKGEWTGLGTSEVVDATHSACPTLHLTALAGLGRRGSCVRELRAWRGFGAARARHPRGGRQTSIRHEVSSTTVLRALLAGGTWAWTPTARSAGVRLAPLCLRWPSCSLEAASTVGLAQRPISSRGLHRVRWSRDAWGRLQTRDVGQVAGWRGGRVELKSAMPGRGARPVEGRDLIPPGVR